MTLPTTGPIGRPARADEATVAGTGVGKGEAASEGEAPLLDLVLAAARGAAAKSLEETVVLEVGELLGITDYFVVTAGRNDRQVRAIVEEIAAQVRAAGGTSTRRVEGLAEAEWVLVDYGSFVVHVFGVEARERFGLERLWSDAPRVALEADFALGGVPG